MAYETKPNTGSLFRNEKKTEDTHADYNGSAVIDGVDYWVNAWINEIKSGENAGKKYMSLKFKEKEARGQQSGGSSRQQPAAHDADDDIPF